LVYMVLVYIWYCCIYVIGVYMVLVYIWYWCIYGIGVYMVLVEGRAALNIKIDHVTHVKGGFIDSLTKKRKVEHRLFILVGNL
jgi:hypothetical protein